MDVQAEIYKKFYDIHGRKYIDLVIDGHITRVKVPFRYNRVMCHVDGITPIQDMEEGTRVRAFIEKTLWEGDIHWILRGIHTLE
jgi:hypothetical protein